MKQRYKPNHIPEAKIENYLVQEVEKLGGECIKGNPHNQRGMPDRILILPKGLIVFVEVKRPGLKPRPNQRYTINRYKQLGHFAVYVNHYHKIDALIGWIKKKLKEYVNNTHKYRLCDRFECKERIK